MLNTQGVASHRHLYWDVGGGRCPGGVEGRDRGLGLAVDWLLRMACRGMRMPTIGFGWGLWKSGWLDDDEPL